LNEQADSIYQITERLAIQEKDSNLLADVLSQRGMIDINRGKEYYSEANLCNKYKLAILLYMYPANLLSEMLWA